MSFLKELQNAKLKKSSEPTRDFSSPKTAGFLNQSDIDSYQSGVLDVNTEEWFDLLKDFTFPSVSESLSIEEARLFKDIYERLYHNLDPQSISKLPWNSALNPKEAEQIEAVRERLQKSIHKFRSTSNDYVFVKLSSRSPKDAPMAQQRFKSLFKSFLLNETQENRLKENTQIQCLLKASFEALRVSTADEVLDACLRSERVYQDLLLALAVEERFRENFIIRKFVNIDVDMEFRAFVYGRRMTSVSQYNYLIFSERLVKSRDLYCKKIIDFFNKEVAPNLLSFVADYIIDFAICDNGYSSKIWVIEINPFMATTDAALFSWEHERDILEGAQSNDVQMRVTERPRPGAKSMLPIGMKDLINECVAELRDVDHIEPKISNE